MGHADMKMIMEVLVYSTLFHKITKPPKPAVYEGTEKV